MWLSQTLCIFSVGNKQIQSPLCSTIQNVLEDHHFPPLLQVKGSQKPSDFLLCLTENTSPKLQDPTHQRWRQNLEDSSNCIRTNCFNKLKYLLNLYNQSLNANRQVQLCLAYWNMLCHNSGQLAIDLGGGKTQQSIITSTVVLVLAFELSVGWNLKRKEKKHTREKGEIPKQTELWHMEKVGRDDKQLNEKLKLVC